MEKKSKLFLLLSLQELSKRKILTFLWNHNDVMNLIRAYKFKSLLSADKLKEWTDVLDQVMVNTEKLPLPTMMKSYLKESIHSIGFEIIKWKHYQETLLCDSNFFVENEIKIVWTDHGSINKKETAKLFIQEEEIDIIQRYKLACIYCLSDDIPLLWRKMSARKKKIFYKTNPSTIQQHELVILWTFEIKNELNKLYNMIQIRWGDCSPYQYAFEYAANDGNKAAAEYFLPKLTNKERKESLVRTTRIIARRHRDAVYKNSKEFRSKYYGEVVYYLLLQMGEQEQEEVFGTDAYSILSCFLDWPLQDIFIKVAGIMWRYLFFKDFNMLLWYLTKNRRTGDDYHKRFSELWLNSPSNFKEHVISQKHVWQAILSYLFTMGDIDNATQILNYVKVEQREAFITCDAGLTLCHRLILINKSSILKLFINLCVVSNSLVEVKANFKRYLLKFYGEDQRGKEALYTFYKLLDSNFKTVEEKRKSENEDSAKVSAKRLCVEKYVK